MARVTVEDCLKIIDGMSFTIKELFDKKKWHTGKPDKGGMFLVYLIDGTYDIYQFGEEYKAWDIGFRDVVAWQKIEPYKGE